MPDLYGPQPAALYHYTSIAAYEGIVKDRAMWATELRFLNDWTEATLSWPAMERLSTLLRDHPSVDMKSNADMFFVYSLSRPGNMPESYWKYLVSFTRRRDDLSQWRGYGRDGGVAIGFHYETLVELSAMNNCILTECRYDRPDQDDARLASALAALNEVRLASARGEFGAMYEIAERYVATILPSKPAAYKHGAFDSEEEFRLIMAEDAGGAPRKVDTHRRGAVLIPHALLSLNGVQLSETSPQPTTTTVHDIITTVHDTTTRLPIRELIVGPTANSELVRAGLIAFNKLHGLGDLAVVPSKIPYRDW
jgi:Protein of unknown function (DUF2971)